MFVYSSRGANKIERRFGFKIKFDLKGEVVSREIAGVSGEVLDVNAREEN